MYLLHVAVGSGVGRDGSASGDELFSPPPQATRGQGTSKSKLNVKDTCFWTVNAYIVFDAQQSPFV